MDRNLASPVAIVVLVSSEGTCSVTASPCLSGCPRIPAGRCCLFVIYLLHMFQVPIKNWTTFWWSSWRERKMSNLMKHKVNHYVLDSKVNLNWIAPSLPPNAFCKESKLFLGQRFWWYRVLHQHWVSRFVCRVQYGLDEQVDVFDWHRLGAFCLCTAEVSSMDSQ